MKKDMGRSVLNELEAIAFSDFTRIVRLERDDSGCQVLSIADTQDMPRRCKRAVCSIKAGTRGVEVKLYDKLKALELLGRSSGVLGAGGTDEADVLEQLRSLFEESDDLEADG